MVFSSIVFVRSCLWTLINCCFNTLKQRHTWAKLIWFPLGISLMRWWLKFFVSAEFHNWMCSWNKWYATENLSSLLCNLSKSPLACCNHKCKPKFGVDHRSEFQLLNQVHRQIFPVSSRQAKYIEEQSLQHSFFHSSFPIFQIFQFSLIQINNSTI